MPPTRIAGWHQAIVNQRTPDGVAVNTYNYGGSDSVPTQAQLTQMAGDFYTTIVPSWRAIHQADTVLESVIVKYLGTQGDPMQGVTSPTSGNVGTRAGDPLPRNCATTVKFLTQFLGRKFRGRSFQYGASDGDAIASNYSTTWLTNVNAHITAILAFAGIVGRSLSPVVASRIGVFLTPIVAAVVDATVDSMRTRLPGRGS